MAKNKSKNKAAEEVEVVDQAPAGADVRDSVEDAELTESQSASVDKLVEQGKAEIKAAPPADKPATTHAVAQKPSMGRIVHFHQEKMGAIGQLESFPAIVLGEASKESNFKPEDMAIDIKIFKRNRAGGDQEKQGVMYSAEPKAGRWSWPVLK